MPERAIPVLRILDEARARSFYVDWLGFRVDWLWRHEPGLPVYLGISRGDLALHLTEHEGDAVAGGAVYCDVEDVDELACALRAGRPEWRGRPRSQPWGRRELALEDPFGNRLCFSSVIAPAGEALDLRWAEGRAMGGTVRKAGEEDRAFLFRLHGEAFREAVDRIWGWDETWQREHFDAWVNLPGRRVLALGDEPMGSFGLQDRGDHLFLEYLAVLPEHQRRGIGSAILREALDEARRRAVPLRLTVLRGNPALAFYLRAGFRILGSEEHRDLLEARSSGC